MSGVENPGEGRRALGRKKSCRAQDRRAQDCRPQDRRLRSAVLAVALGSGTLLVGPAFAGTFSTSPTAPTGANVQISQPDDSQTGGNLSGYQDYTNNYAGTGQVFTPTQNFSMTGFTFQGGSSAGGDLSENWTITIATVQGNYYGGGITPIDVETAVGTPIATDVGNGNTNYYDTLTLAVPVALNANTKYFWAVSSPANGSYYGLAGSVPVNPGAYQQNTTSTEYPGGESADLSDGSNGTNAGHSIFQLQNADHTFYILGSTAVTTSTQWAVNANGNWQVPSNWSANSVPQYEGDTATFGSDNGLITISPVVTLNAPVTIDTLTFSAPAGNSAGGYNISNGGLGKINVGNLSAGSSITALSGNHIIGVPVNLVGNYSVNPAATLTVEPGASLAISSLSGGSYGNVTITGGGSLSVDKLDTMNITLNDGTTVTTVAGGATTRGGYDNFGAGATLNINTAFEVLQLYDDGTETINIGSAGSLVLATNGNSGEYIGGTIAGPGSISIGTDPDQSNSNGGVQLNGNNSNFSGPIYVTNGFQLRLGSQYSINQQNNNSWGNDSATNTLTLDNATLWVVPTITNGVATGFSGTHTVIINGGGGTIETNDANDTNFSGNGAADAGAFTLGIGSISGPGTLTVDGGGNLAIAAQVVAVNASGGIRSLTLGGLNLINNSNISFGSSALAKNRTVFVTGSLSLSGATSAWTSTVDLGNNDMIVQNGNLTKITNEIHQGYANGTWQGSGGILSSAAATNSSHLTALGVIQNSVDGTTGGSVLDSTFDGVSSSNSDVLVKYTYYGDANLNGKVDGTDYSRIDNGFLTHSTGWFNGDFNYDGVVNGSDYTLIDNAYNTQGAQLSAETAAATAQIAGVTISGSSAVPEPASVGLIGIGVAGLLSRRKSRSHR